MDHKLRKLFFETLDQEINSIIDKKTGKVIFEDKGRNAGLEVAGKIDEIII